MTAFRSEYKHNSMEDGASTGVHESDESNGFENGTNDSSTPQWLSSAESNTLSSRDNLGTHGAGGRDAEFSDDRINNDRKIPIRVCVLMCLLLIIVLVTVDSFSANGHVKGAATSFLSWVETHPVYGVFAVVIAYATATVLFVPGAPLTLGCGFAFGMAFGLWKGVVLASIAVWVGASLGSIGSFLLGRYLFRDFVVGMAQRYPLFQAIDRALQGNGLKIMVLLRLSPLIPYNALDYLSGVTAIPLWSYSVALIALLPGVIMFCFVGATASQLADENDDVTTEENSNARIVSIVFGVIFAVAGVGVASYHANEELKKIIATNATEDDEDDQILGRLDNDMEFV